MYIVGRVGYYLFHFKSKIKNDLIILYCLETPTISIDNIIVM